MIQGILCTVTAHGQWPRNNLYCHCCCLRGLTNSRLPEFDAYRSIQFIGDIHQPLHDEALDIGGNTVDVTFAGDSTNLHAVWDTSIPGM